MLLLVGGELSFVFLNTRIASASYTGKTLRTVEYVLGGGTSEVPESRSTIVYAGSAWNTTRTSAGTSTIYIKGSGIRVRSAYLDVSFNATSTTVDISDIDMTLALSAGAAPGVDARVGIQLANTGAPFADNSGASLNRFQTHANVVGLMNSISDAEWSTGVGVVGSLSVATTLVGSALASMKLVITYESDHTEAAYDSVKTVRFPLSSTSTGDTGSKTAACAASAVCAFSYYADLPDLNNQNDIYDVWFEIRGMTDSASVPTFTPRIQGGASGPTYTWTDSNATVGDMLVYWKPSTSTPNFATGTTQYLEFVNGSVAHNIVGGEVVVTYKYSTGAPSQAETVRYFMGQQSVESGTATSSAMTQSIAISNPGSSVKNLWLKARTAHSGAQSWTIAGTVGAASEKQNIYTITGTNARAGTAVVIYDMTADIASFSSSPTTITAESQMSSGTGDSEVGIELYATFTWNGTPGTQTKTVTVFAGSDQSATNVANEYHNFSFPVFTPEQTTKTYRSGYVVTHFTHSEAGNLAFGAQTWTINGTSTLSFTEQDDLESYTTAFLQEMPADLFTAGAGTDIPFVVSNVNLTRSANIADEMFYTNEFVLTYDVDLSAAASGIELVHYRWRHTNGDETGATYAAPEDTQYSGAYAGDRYRLRMLVSSTGSTDYQYLLEYASSSCMDWTPVPQSASAGEHWEMRYSSYLPDLYPTSNVAGLLSDPPGESFVAGKFMAKSNPSPAIALTDAQFTELTYVVAAKSVAEPGVTYCFRLTDNGDPSAFTYTVTPQVVITSNPRPQAGGSSVEASGSGPAVGGGHLAGGTTGGGESGNGAGSTGGTPTAPTFIQEAETTSWTNNTTPKTTASFTVEAGDILVAYAMAENDSTTLGISGGSLTWTLRQDITGYGSYSDLRIWTAVVDTNKSMTVSFTQTGSIHFGGNVLTFRGSDGVGASNGTHTSGAPTLNLTTTQSNSAIVVANADWNAGDGSSRTWRTNAGSFSEKSYDGIPSSDYIIYGGYHADAGAIGTYAVGLSSPTGQAYAIGAIEVKGSTSGGATPTGGGGAGGGGGDSE